MKHSILFLIAALLVSFWLPSTGEARHPRGSTMTGQLPVLQDLNGRQVETRFRLITGVSIAF